MKTIEQQLTKEFATFKVDYLNQVEDWTIETQKYFQSIQNEYNQIQRCKAPKKINEMIRNSWGCFMTTKVVPLTY